MYSDTYITQGIDRKQITMNTCTLNTFSFYVFSLSCYWCSFCCCCRTSFFFNLVWFSYGKHVKSIARCTKFRSPCCCCRSRPTHSAVPRPVPAFRHCCHPWLRRLRSSWALCCVASSCPSVSSTWSPAVCMLRIVYI